MLGLSYTTMTENSSGRIAKEVAKGYNCQSFYVLIQCTDNCTPDDFSRAGQGHVDDKMYEDMFGQRLQDGLTCCGGFAVMKGVDKFSSAWLNTQSSGSNVPVQWE